MNKRSILLLFFLIFIVTAFGQQKDGAYSFLDATNSARVAALGGTLVPIQDSDIQLDIHNPSLINDDINNAMALSYVDYYRDINFATFQYGKSFNKIGNFVGTVQFHNYGKFYYADQSGYQDESTFTASDYAFYVGWGRQLNPRFSIGANLKFAGFQYENFSSFAMAVDVAGNYRSKTGWMFSLTARNIGYELYNNLEGNKNKLPFNMQFGVSKKLEHIPFLFMVVYDNIQKWNLHYDDPLDLEGNYDPITGEMKKKGALDQFATNLFSHIVFGGEIYIGKNLILRIGYNYGLRQNMKTPTKKGVVGLSYGIGIHIYKFDINYSRSEMHIYGSPNYISITTNLGRFVKKH